MSNKLLSNANLFYDIANGRSIDKNYCKDICIADVSIFTVNVEFDLSRLNADVFNSWFHFDPVEGYFIKLYEIKIMCDGVELDSNQIQYLNASTHFNGDVQYFLTPDPIMCLKLPVTKSLSITYDAEVIRPDELSQAILYNEQRSVESNTFANRLKKKLGLACYTQIHFTYEHEDPLVLQLKSNLSLIKSIKGCKSILFVFHSGEKHGSILMFKNFIYYAKKNFNINPIILVLSNNIIKRDFEKLGVVYDLDLSFFDINLRKGLLNKMLTDIYDIDCTTAICNSLTTGIVTDSLKEHNFKVVQLVHEMPELVQFNNLTNAAEVSFNNADDYVFPSEYVEHQYKNQGIVFNGKIHIVPQGLYNVEGLSEFSEKADFKRKICKTLGCDKKSNIVLGCGTGYLVKGIDYFVDVAIDVINKIPNTQFIWIGHFDLAFDNMGKILAQRQIKLAGMEENIHLFDFVDNPSDYFAAADIYFLPSRNDTFPSTVLEAAASFTPSVIFEDAGGIQDFVKDGVNGKIVDYCNAVNAEESMITLLKDRNMLKKLAKKTHENSLLYTMDVYIEKIMKILFKKI